MNNDKAITKHVHTGDVLQPPRDLKVTITIDMEAMRRALDQARLALAGMAVRAASWQRPNERDVIDQD